MPWENDGKVICDICRWQTKTTILNRKSKELRESGGFIEKSWKVACPVCQVSDLYGGQETEPWHYGFSRAERLDQENS